MIQKETKEVPEFHYDRRDLEEMIEAHSKWLGSDRQLGSRFRLEHTDIQGSFGESVFVNRNLKQARFSYVRFFYCDFSNTNFRDSTFYGCSFHNCTFYNNDFKYNSIDEGTPFVMCKGVVSLEGADGYRMIAFEFDDEPRFMAGCRWFTKDQAFEHWSIEHPSVEDDGGKHCRIANSAVNSLLMLGDLMGWAGCKF